MTMGNEEPTSQTELTAGLKMKARGKLILGVARSSRQKPDVHLAV